jgi:hypothetical protein
MTLAASFWIHIENLFKIARRMQAVKEARRYSNTVGKPLLNYGCEGTTFGDVNVDISEQDVPNFVLIEPSPAPTPFPDKHFGAVVCNHVIEHVPDPEVLQCELERIADKVHMISPSPVFLYTWLWPDHKWVFINGKQFSIEESMVVKLFGI